MKVRGTNSEGELVERTAIVEVKQIYVNKITVTPNPLRIDQNQEYTFNESNIKIEPDEATNKELVWKSKNPSIVEGLENGKVRGVSTGTTEVTITSADGKAINDYHCECRFSFSKYLYEVIQKWKKDKLKTQMII